MLCHVAITTLVRKSVERERVHFPAPARMPRNAAAQPELAACAGIVGDRKRSVVFTWTARGAVSARGPNFTSVNLRMRVRVMHSYSFTEARVSIRVRIRARVRRGLGFGTGLSNGPTGHY